MPELLNKNELNSVIKSFLLEEKVDIGSIMQAIQDSIQNIKPASKQDSFRKQSALRHLAELKNIVSRMKTTIDNYRQEQLSK